MPITKSLRLNKNVEDFEDLISTEAGSINHSNEFVEELKVESLEETTNSTEKKKNTFFSFLKDQLLNQYLYKIK
ncbi:hypothetical protein OAF63_01990 [Saprospiraceae bacterium]|jgi:flagellar biogenesis protein FliO|nr:hypothetical protein [Bacteroidota bacterium]MDB4727535.1 hypothetical protein [Saprospiraceae bacterium]MDF1866247.1 hypothetical protein [Saprospiraceae bacterium]